MPCPTEKAPAPKYLLAAELDLEPNSADTYLSGLPTPGCSFIIQIKDDQEPELQAGFISPFNTVKTGSKMEYELGGVFVVAGGVLYVYC